MIHSEWESALPELERALVSAAVAGDPETVAEALNTKGVAVAELGRFDEGVALLGEQRRHAADARRLRLAAELSDPLEALRRVGGCDRRIGLEADPGGGARDLAIGRDILALAEERLVERVLEVTKSALLAGPEARRERQRRARLVARQVDLDPERERAAVDVLRPVDAQMVASHLEQRLRRRAELERQPLDLDAARILRSLDRVRLHVRVRTDDVVVEADPGHRRGPAY